eukprot:SAG31_NODE_24330_length_484_cov_0.742857_1_plen_77_part_00
MAATEPPDAAFEALLVGAATDDGSRSAAYDAVVPGGELSAAALSMLPKLAALTRDSSGAESVARRCAAARCGIAAI